MKVVSKYLNITAHEDKFIFFNLLSGTLFSVNSEKYDLFKKYEKKIESLEEEDKEFYDGLFKSRSIIDNDFNEINMIRFRNKRDIFLDKSFHLTINPTMDCNFKCWYCYETCESGSRMNSQVKKNILKLIETKVANKEISRLELNWFGGEPMMYFKDIIYPISKKIKEICETNGIPFTNAITTNGYLVSVCSKTLNFIYSYI